MFDFNEQDWLPLHGIPVQNMSSQHLSEFQALFGGKTTGLVLLANQADEAIRVPPGIALRHEVVAWADSRPEELGRMTEETLLPSLIQLRDQHGGRAKYVRLVVRSSGNLEDGTESGFPGVFSTVDEVTPDEESVVEAIRVVLASSTTDQAKAYCENQNIPFSEIKMACVLQWQVESAISGVAMTSTNSSVRDQYLLLNFAKGNCRNVVDGKSNNEMVFTKDDPIVPVNVSCRDFDHLVWNCRTPYTEFANGANQNSVSLEALAEVARRCVMIESLHCFGRPMDIEWTIDHDGDIYMLQARPIVHRQAIALKPGM